MHSTRVLESGQSLTELLRSATEVHFGQVFLARASSSFVFFFSSPPLLTSSAWSHLWRGQPGIRDCF